MKTLVDEIRDMIGEARTRGMYPVVTDAASDLLGRSCWSEEDEAELLTIIADRIEREYLPRPRFEDGEPVQFRDEFSDRNNERDFIRGIAVYDDGLYVLVGKDDVKECVPSGDRVKRQEPEVMDYDGVPIHVGDTVYFVGDSEYFDVLGIEIDGDEPVHIGRNDGTSTDAWASPSDLTHKQPDTLERIEADAKKDLLQYWGCSGARCVECPALIDGKTPEDHYHTDSCEDAKVLDLLRRQRELLESGQA